MAIDTEAKRKSSAMFLIPCYTNLIPPDGIMSQANRQVAAWYYAGILAFILTYPSGMLGVTFEGRTTILTSTTATSGIEIMVIKPLVEIMGV